MTDTDPDDTDDETHRFGDELPSLREIVAVLAPSVPSPLHLLRAGMKGLDAAFDAIRLALEADEEATVAALKAHEDPVDTLAALAKIIQGGDDG